MKLISLVFGLLLAALSFGAFAQSDDVAKHAATMEAIGKLADAMGKQADALKIAVERGGNSQPVIVQAAAAPIRDCTGWAFLGCAIRETWSGVKDVVHEVAPFAGPVAQVLSTRYQVDGQKFAAAEARLTNADNQQTLQTAFTVLKPQPATPAPIQPAIPTSQITINGGAVNLGNGTQNNSSNNPVNPLPIVVTCTPVTTTGPGGTTTTTPCTR